MSLAGEADKLSAAAFEASGAKDPREYYRGQLRALKERGGGAYRTAVEYFEKTLVPAIVGGADPVGEWLEYGRILAELLTDGTTVQVDETGRATAYRRPVPSGHLVLHLPTSAREKAIAVGLPPQLSAAQKATFDLLVRQRVDVPA